MPAPSVLPGPYIDAAAAVLTIPLAVSDPPLHVGQEIAGIALFADGVEILLDNRAIVGTDIVADIVTPIYAAQVLWLNIIEGNDVLDDNDDELVPVVQYPVTNNATAALPETDFFWTTRAKVETRWGAANTTIWSNKGNDYASADLAAWAGALADTDAKFNYEFASRDFAIPPWDAADTSPIFAQFKIWASIWAGTELYFARGLLDAAGGDEIEQRDKMQGWRNYVEDKIADAFARGLDISVITDDSGVAPGGGITVVQPLIDPACIPSPLAGGPGYFL